MELLLGGYMVVYLAGLVGLLWVAHRSRRRYALAKGIQSSLFVLAAVLAYATGTHQHLAAFLMLLAALVMCAVGDVMLGIANRSKTPRAKPFVSGAVCFLVAHLCFCAVYISFVPLRWWDILPPLAMLLLLWRLERRGSIRLKKMRTMGYVYTFLVSLMTTKAVSFSLTVGAGSQLAELTTDGALLFLLSDVILLFLYFGVRRSRWLRAANLSSYYLGILLLGLTAHWY